MPPHPEAVLQQLYPTVYRKMVVALTRYFSFASLAQAEDLVQDTFAAALQEWRMNGVPQNPEGWLFKVCKNKALNSRKKASKDVGGPFAPANAAVYELEQAFSEHEIEDSELKMIYACCHPRFSAKAQLILILKTLCGFSTERVAQHINTKAEAVRKLHYRTLQTIREEKITLNSPHILRLADRTANVHRSIYLLFNEGYSAFKGAQLVEYDSCMEAMRLIRLMLRHPAVRKADSHALYALFLFHLARIPARTTSCGELIALEQQNRSLWLSEMISLGIHQLNLSLNAQEKLSRYQLEALIASLHCTAPSFPETDWKKISAFYDRLLQLSDNPFMALNKAIALYFAAGLKEAFNYLLLSPYQHFFQEHSSYHALMGRMHGETGNISLATQHYQLAIRLTQNKLEKEFLQKKLTRLQE